MSRTGLAAASLVGGGIGAAVLDGVLKEDRSPRSQAEASKMLDKDRSAARTGAVVGASALFVATTLKGTGGAALAALGAMQLGAGLVRSISLAGEKGSDRTDLPENHSPAAPKTDADRAQEERVKAKSERASDG